MENIKFRAWRTDVNKMVSVESGIFLEDRIDSGSVDKYTLDYDSAFEWSDDIYKLMQFVGLQDANGRDIYEGDIIIIEGATAKVVFWERPPEFDLDYSHNEDKWCEDWNLCDDSERMEIIGNIYENPELLK